RGADRVGEDIGDTWMDALEVSASEVCVMLGVVMLVVDVETCRCECGRDREGGEGGGHSRG
ncbi:hypothetical protein NDU88_007138, partial [Pleurodeles waltl]